MSAEILFPVPASQIISGFTSCSAVINPRVHVFALSDNALGVHKIYSRTSHEIVTPPPPRSGHNLTQLAWEAIFPEGSINPGNKDTVPGGFGFYLRGPKTFAEQLQNPSHRDVIMSYSVMFEDGYRWRKGGKLPGICESLLTVIVLRS